MAAQARRIKTKQVERFPLSKDERGAAASLPGLPAKLKKKLATSDATFSIAEVAAMLTALAESVEGAEPAGQNDCLQV